MNAIQKLTLTNIRQNKKRTVATILGILLSTALICAVAGMVSSGVESLKNYLRAHDGDYHVWFDNVPAEHVSLITEDEHTARSYIVENIGYAPLADGLNPYKPYYHLIGMTPEGMEHLGLTLTKGRLPESENEIVISDHISYDAGGSLQIGDSLTLEVGTRVGSDGQELTQLDPYEIETDENGDPLYPEESITDTVSRTFEVVGITERPIRPIENYSSPGYTLITLADEHPEGTLSVAVTYHNAKQFVTCTQQILENLSSAGLDNIAASDNKDLLEMEGALAQRTLGVLYTLAAIILLIILATSVFVIRNSFVISVSEKTRQYGMLSSLGATSRQLRRSVLFEGLVLGLIGIPLGILLGVAAVLILIRILNLLLGNIMVGMHFVYSIPPATFLLTIALGAVTILLSSLLPAIRAGRTSPIEAIRGAEQINLSGRRLRVSPLYKKWFGMGGVIAAKNLKRSRRKYRTTVISLILSTSVFIALSSFTSMGRQAAGMIYSDHGYNIAVSTQGNPAMHEAYDTILKQIEAKKAAYYYTTGADMDVRYLSDEYPNRYEGQESEYVQVFLLEPDAFSALAQEAGVQADDVVELAEFDHFVCGGFRGTVLFQSGEEVIEGFGNGVYGAACPEYDGESHFFQFFGRDKRCLAAFDHVGYDVGAASFHTSGEFFQFFPASDTIGEADFSTGVGIAFASFDGVVDAVNGAAVGAGHNHCFLIQAGIHGGADFLGMFFSGDDLLAVHVAAAFRPCLVFEENAGSAGLFKHALRADGIQRIAVARIAVRHGRNVHCVADAGKLVHHFTAGEKAHVRLSQKRCGHGVAAHDDAADACLLCDFCRQRIPYARGDQNLSGL